MGSLLEILICTSLLVSVNSQALFDDIGERQRSEDHVLHFLRTELKQLRQDIEGMVMKKLDEVENVIEKKISNMIETKTTNLSRKVEKNSDHITTTQTEQRLLKQEMESLNSKADTLVNKSITNCADILDFYPDTREKDGVYNIIDSKTLYCDMTTDNGGWTVIQRRVNGSVDFYRNWTEYKNGFGFGDHEYWIGNDMLHRLTSLKPQELRVDMESFNGEKAHAAYSRFSVGDEASKYKLEVQGYSGNAGDGLDYHNNMKFSTPDQDNDRRSGSCATEYRSAGWFNNCHYANPNGQYTDSEKTGGKYIAWWKWKNSNISLKKMQLMIRPRA
ncbi:microfibril-associated glycoprotein 4 [Magallana gigas]|uniref:microfibril-associated glycoprotein 4 n=1 Tax=Magallana gigas TaxID=29159 RepID=UPI003341DDD0